MATLNSFPSVSAATQMDRDKDRLLILERERELNPNDTALARELEFERRKQGVSAPTQPPQDDVTWDEGITWDSEPKKPSPTRVTARPNHGVSTLDTGVSGAVGKALKKVLPQGAIDATVGMTNFPRQVLNQASDGLGERIFPSSPSSGSGWETAGELLDPFAMATGVKGAQALGSVAPRLFAAGGYEALKGKPMLDAVKALGRNMATGSATGAALQGVQQGGDATTGAILGGAIPGAASAIGVGKNFLAEAIGPLREGWRTAQMQKKLAEILGRGNVDKVATQLEQAAPGQTAGDVLAASGSTEGAPIVAMEEAFSRDPRLAGKAKEIQNLREQRKLDELGRFAKGQDVIDTSVARRGEVTDPMRQEALTAANTAAKTPKYLQPTLEAATGMVPLKPDTVIKNLNRIRSAPGNKANPTVQSAMDEVENLIQNAVSKKGTIRAEELYTLRKQAGNTIKKFASDNKDWDQRYTSGLLNDVQSSIDDAIENAAGNTGQWKRYLDVYTKRSKGINQMKLGEELVNALRSGTGTERPGAFANKARQLEGEMETTVSPRQQASVDKVQDMVNQDAARKNLAKNVDVSEFANATNEGQVRIPHMLSRTATVSNMLLGLLGKNANEKISRDVGQLLLTNPRGFSEKYLKQVPPEQAGRIVKLLRSGKGLQYPAVSAASEEQ